MARVRLLRAKCLPGVKLRCNHFPPAKGFEEWQRLFIYADETLGRIAAEQIRPIPPQSAATQQFLRAGPVDAELGRGNDAALMVANVEAGVTSATFRIPVAVSIAGNNVIQKVPVNSVRLPATLQFQSTPKMLEAAFLSAHAMNSSEYPLLAGPMNTYFDDTFVASSSLKTVMPGQEFELALGVDDGISVKRRLVNRFSEDTGLTNKTRRITYEISVTLTNNKPTQERVVYEQAPQIAQRGCLTAQSRRHF